MPDEIIKQTSAYVIYRTTDPGPAVPYIAEGRENSVNYGFKDLRDHPELVADLIPEVTKSEGLAGILRTLNARGSPLMSIGCECKMNGRDGISDGHPFYFYSYTDLTFRDPTLHATEDQIVSLAEAFLFKVRGEEGIAFGYELGVQRMKKFFGVRGGYNLNLALMGYGRSEEGAIAAHEAGAKATANAFAAVIAKAH